MEDKSYTVLLTDVNFKEEVLDCSQPILVVFETDWSGTCHIISPIIEKLAKRHRGYLKIGRLDFDKNEVVKWKYGIRIIPTILFIKNGLVRDQIVGAVSEDVLEQKVTELFLNLPG